MCLNSYHCIDTVRHKIWIVTHLKTNTDKYSSAPEGNQFSEAFSQLYVFSSQHKRDEFCCIALKYNILKTRHLYKSVKAGLIQERPNLV